MITKTRNFSFILLSAVAFLGFACQPESTNNNISSNKTNINAVANNNANNNANVSNTNSSNETGIVIETKEPEQYQATVTLKLETSGSQSLTMPPLKAEVARNGQDRRMEFSMPNGEKVVYLDKNSKQYIISPTRKQYAELNKESLGFDVRRMLMPEQIVNQMKNIKGVERVGEEKVDGRDVVKYRYAATTNTQTKAGNVETESYFLVDKETGLPLRSETVSESQSGNVQGISGLRLVTELNNVRTETTDELFALPTDFKMVAPEEIRQQVNTLFSAAVAIIGQMLKTAQPATTPAASPKS